MRYQFIFLMIFFGISMVRPQKLTQEENEERLRNCGNDHLPAPASNIKQYADGVTFDYFNKSVNTPWLYYIKSNDPSDYDTTAFAISPRHIFTSAQVILNEYATWRSNGEKFGKECDGKINGTYVAGHVDVPLEHFSHFDIWNKYTEYQGKIIGARLFQVCPMTDFYYRFAPLLLELDTPLNGSLPCLADENTQIKVETVKNGKVVEYGEAVDAYGMEMGDMEHRKVLIKEQKMNRWLIVNDFDVTGDRGGPLVKMIEGKSTVIGLKATDGWENTGNNHYNDLSKLSKDICDYSGVCPKSNTVPSTTTVPPTSEEPSSASIQTSSSPTTTTDPNTVPPTTESSTDIPTSSSPSPATTSTGNPEPSTEESIPYIYPNFSEDELETNKILDSPTHSGNKEEKKYYLCWRGIFGFCP